MSESVDWQTAFRAVSALVGEPAEAVAAALGEAPGEGAGELGRGLASPSREVRARAVARIVTAILTDVERVRLA